MDADLRLICQRCGVKWFVRGGRAGEEAPACAACGGELAELEHEELPPAWDANPEL